MEARQSEPGPRASGGLLFASSSALSSRSGTSLFLPFLILERTPSGQERTVSHSWYPLVTSTRILLLLSVTQDSRRAPGRVGKRARVYSSSQASPGSRAGRAQPPGHHTLPAGPCGHRKLAPTPRMHTLRGYAVAPSPRLRSPRRPARSLTLV